MNSEQQSALVIFFFVVAVVFALGVLTGMAI